MIPLDEISHRLTTALQERVAAEGPCQDAVLSRVQSLALNCLSTGVCILKCDNPIETKYGIIPADRLESLRTSFDGEQEVSKNVIIQRIIDDFYTSPNIYFPEPYMIVVFTKDTTTEVQGKLKELSFESYRRNYEILEGGIPNTPGGVLDVIRSEYCVGEDRFVALVKGGMDEAGQGWQGYLDKVNPLHDNYTALIGSLISVHMDQYLPEVSEKEGDEVPEKVKVSIPLVLEWKLRFILGNPDCYFDEFLKVALPKPEEQHIVRFIQQIIDIKREELSREMEEWEHEPA